MHIVITGPPGSGKTSLLEMGKSTIYRLDHVILPDYPRLLIEKGLIPSQDHLKFQHQWVDMEISAFITYSNRIFTHGFQDAIVYFIWRDGANFIIPDFFHRAIKAYQMDAIILVEPLPAELYKNDIARPMSYPESLEIMKIMEEVYPRYGYELIRIPYMSLNERTAFFLDILKKLLA